MPFTIGSRFQHYYLFVSLSCSTLRIPPSGPLHRICLLSHFGSFSTFLMPLSSHLTSLIFHDHLSTLGRYSIPVNSPSLVYLHAVRLVGPSLIPSFVTDIHTSRVSRVFIPRKVIVSPEYTRRILSYRLFDSLAGVRLLATYQERCTMCRKRSQLLNDMLPP